MGDAEAATLWTLFGMALACVPWCVLFICYACNRERFIGRTCQQRNDYQAENEQLRETVESLEAALNRRDNIIDECSKLLASIYDERNGHEAVMAVKMGTLTGLLKMAGCDEEECDCECDGEITYEISGDGPCYGCEHDDDSGIVCEPCVFGRCLRDCEGYECQGRRERETNGEDDK